jgi:hypothetical protein
MDGSLAQFFGLRAIAANIVGDNVSSYTLDMFKEDFPQFYDEPGDPLIPPNMLNLFLAMANASVLEDKWFEKWRWAMGMYIAHYGTLYLESYRPFSENAQQAAQAGEITGQVQSASLGDASVSYDTSAAVAATERWGTWNDTIYGQQLVAEAKLIALGGMYVI